MITVSHPLTIGYNEFHLRRSQADSVSLLDLEYIANHFAYPTAIFGQ